MKYPLIGDKLFTDTLHLLNIIVQTNDDIHFKMFWRVRQWYIDTLEYAITCKWVIDEEYLMANKFNWNTVQARLTKAHKKKVIDFAESYDNDMQSLFDILVDDNIKLSMTYSEKQTSWIATFTRKEDHKLQKSTSMSSWSNDPVEALWITFYKHVVMFSRDVWESTEDAQAWG